MGYIQNENPEYCLSERHVVSVEDAFILSYTFTCRCAQASTHLHTCACSPSAQMQRQEIHADVPVSGTHTYARGCADDVIMFPTCLGVSLGQIFCCVCIRSAASR